MESVIKDNLLNLVLSYNIVTSKKHGFLPKRLACFSMLDCNYDWWNAVDSNNTVDVIIIDFCKIFDVVPYTFFLKKLSPEGVCSRTL